MNMNSMFSSDQDRNAPDRYLDTAYKALKGNPNATNQVLQAAAQGQAVGLKGLAAAAAQQSQQQAQQAMAQQQAQTAGQQPTIIQKLAQQGQGIMGQLPGSIQLASAPTADMAPQNMAGGGLVAFADGGAVGNDIDGSFGYEAADAYGDGSQGYAGGGLVSFAEGGALPPDVIDAIQSHFAYGGEVRGFAEGDFLSPDEVQTKYDQMQKEIQDLLERKHLESKYRGLKGMSPEEMAREKARHAERVKMGRLSESSGFEPSAAEPEPKGPGYSDVYSEARAESAPEPASYRKLYGNAPRSIKEQYTTTAEPPAPKGPSYGDLYPKSAGPAGPNMYERARYKDLYPSAEGAPEYTPYRPPEGPGPSMMERLAAHSAEPAARLDPNMAKLARMAGQELPEIPKAADAWTGGEGFSGAGKLGELGKGLGRFMSNPALGLLSPEVRGAANLYTGAAKKAVGMDGLQDIASGANQLFDVGLPDVPTEQLSGALNWFRGADDEDMGDGYPKALGKKGKDAEVKQEGTYVPDPATVAPNQPEITPKSEVHKEGQKVSKEFETVKQPTPSVATTPGADTASLTSGESYGVLDSMGLGGLEQARDLVSQLRGQQRMDPEIAKRLEDMQSGARNSTIMQSIMGALGKGLTSRPGGRIALGEAALGALAGYQHGASSEDDMQRKAFDVYKNYADMPISEQQHAADFILKAEKDKAAQQSAERIAENKGDDALMRLLYSERGKDERSQRMVGQKGGLTEGQAVGSYDSFLKMAQDYYLKQGLTPTPAQVNTLAKQYMNEALSATRQGFGDGSQLGAGGLGGGSGGLTVTRSGVVR